MAGDMRVEVAGVGGGQGHSRLRRAYERTQNTTTHDFSSLLRGSQNFNLTYIS